MRFGYLLPAQLGGKVYRGVGVHAERGRAVPVTLQVPGGAPPGMPAVMIEPDQPVREPLSLHIKFYTGAPGAARPANPVLAR